MHLMSSGMPSDMCDEDYFVFRAKQAQTHNKFEARAWFITAQTLFPNNFKIQFEAYCMQKDNGNLLEAGKTLEFLLRNFQNEELVWREISVIVDILRSEEVNSQNKLLRDLYTAMPTDVQRLMLLSIAEKTVDIIERCKLLIMMLDRFKECIPQYGVRLIEDLLSAEKRAAYSHPVNSLRKLLVCDILPLVLSVPTIDLSQKHLYYILNQSIEFYLYSIMKPTDREEFGPHSSWDKSLLSKSPWNDLGVILELVGRILGWELKDLLKTNNWKVQRQRLQSLYIASGHGTLDDKTSFSFNQVFYCSTILFLRGFCEYVSIVDPSQIIASTEEKFCSAVLVEGFQDLAMDYYEGNLSGVLMNRSKPKKMKYDIEGRDGCDPTLSVSTHFAQDSNLSHSFITAVRCWEILNKSESLATDFARFCQNLSIDSWLCFQNFQADILLYKGLYKEALQWLSEMPVPNVAGYREKLLLQAACCHFKLGDHLMACRKTMEVVCILTEKQSPLNQTVENFTFLTKPVRHLVFLSLSLSDILYFCIKLFVDRLKGVALFTDNDVAIGHLLVLLQYDWPNEDSLFVEIINLIKHRGTLTYSIFFNYIINIDILEEFTHLSLPVGGNLVFNFLPVSEAQTSKQRTITRGVNKGVKEDFRAAMERQVSRCDENISSLLVQFLMQEQETLFQNVHSVRPSVHPID